MKLSRPRKRLARPEMRTQLPFDFPIDAIYRSEDYIQFPENRVLFESLMAWPEKRDHALLLVGPSGSGKSHLAHIWRERVGGRCLNAGDSIGDLVAGNHVLIEDIDQLQDAEDWLFHLLNWAKEAGCHVLLTAQLGPGRLPIALDDLASRLKALQTLVIAPPTDGQLATVLQKLLSDRQVIVAPRVIEYILPRMQRSMAAVRWMAAALDQTALQEKRAITIDLARAILESDAYNNFCSSTST